MQNSITPKTILFTGGGSAGHVTPNLALIKQFQSENWQCVYIGSEKGIEKQIISRIHIPYYSIATGKLRRYFSLQNFLDPFKILFGTAQAYFLCRRLKPKIVFSKGGFVAFPVVVGAWLNKIPVVCHESDLTPGFANRLSFPFAKLICVTFAETQKYFKDKTKIKLTGTPLREDLFKGDAAKGRALCGFNTDKPILLITGGGLGSDNINFAIRKMLPALLQQFQIIHLCGKNKTDSKFDNLAGYKQFDYVNEELADLFACTDVVVSRAGANAIYELIALQKLNILIPLSASASRGDQLINARYCKDHGMSEVITEEALTEQLMLDTLKKIHDQKNQYQAAIAKLILPNSTLMIHDELIKIITSSN